MHIARVLRDFTPDKYAQLQEAAERQGRADARLASFDYAQEGRLLRAEAFERDEILAMGRPEYVYVKNARKKETLYARRRAGLERIAEIRRASMERIALKEQLYIVDEEEVTEVCTSTNFYSLI